MILDTNGLSAMADGEPALAELLRGISDLAIPVIVLGEYRYGIRQSRFASRYESWLEQTTSLCRILPIDQETAGFYAVVRQELKQAGKPIPGNDLWIAALARQHNFPIISRDQHFDFVPELQRVTW